MLSFIFRLLLCQYFCRIIRGDKILLSKSNRDNVHIAFIFHLKPFLCFLSFLLSSRLQLQYNGGCGGLSFLISTSLSQVHSSPFKRNVQHHHLISIHKHWSSLFLVYSRSPGITKLNTYLLDAASSDIGIRNDDDDFDFLDISLFFFFFHMINTSSQCSNFHNMSRIIILYIYTLKSHHCCIMFCM